MKRFFFLSLCLLLSACATMHQAVRTDLQTAGVDYIAGISLHKQAIKYNGETTIGTTLSAQVIWSEFIGIRASYSNAAFDTDVNSQNLHVKSNQYSISGILRTRLLLIFATGMSGVRLNDFPYDKGLILAFFPKLYLSFGGTFTDQAASFNGMSNSDNFFTGFYEIGISTTPIHHISAYLAYRITNDRAYNIDSLTYTVGGNSLVFGINAVF